MSWWRHQGGGNSASSYGVSDRMANCEEDPLGALAELQEEQARIAQELEETFLAYDHKLQAMAERLGSHDREPSSKELANLRQEQLDLWRLVRRAQAAVRSTRELERELSEWTERTDVVAPHGHPDHPQTRAEIIGSELRVRGGIASASEEMRSARTTPRVMEISATQDVLPVVAFSEGMVQGLSPEWQTTDEAHILRELVSRERELERLRDALDIDPSLDAEIALMNKEMQELRKHLREQDVASV